MTHWTKGLALWGLVATSACGTVKTVTVKEVYESGLNPPRARTPEKSEEPGKAMERGEMPADCEVSIQLENKDKAGNLVLFSEATCIKTLNQPMALPSKLWLWLDTNDVPKDICRDGTYEAVAAPADHGNAESAIARCEWNGVFRDSNPVTFVIRSHGVADPPKPPPANPSPSPPLARPLSSYVQGVRVLRNGELAWTWLPADDYTRQATQIIIPGTSLRGKGLPEGAAIDLRVFPVGVEIDQAVLTARVKDRPRYWEKQLQLAGRALLDSPSFAQGTLGNQVKCLQYRAQMMQFHASQIAGSPSSEPQNPADCPTPETPAAALGANGSLVARYADLKRRSIKDISDLQDKFVKDVGDYST